MKYNLFDKVVIVTGGTSGIGLTTEAFFCKTGPKSLLLAAVPTRDEDIKTS